MGQIIRDERYENTLWCLCNNYEEYLQFAKDLYQLRGKYYWGEYCENEDTKWIEDENEYADIFGIDFIPDENDEDFEYAPDPMNDTYEMKEKPNENEYPVIVNYSDCYKNVLWISLNKLQNK